MTRQIFPQARQECLGYRQRPRKDWLVNYQCHDLPDQQQR
jgi:hypothetical protein